tara:strand:- start:2696 stop:8440 length:5745 start_codon:yes stop_codon:yes gene_type:complete
MLGFAGNIWNGTTDVFEGLGSFGADVVRAAGELGSGDVAGAADVIVNSVQEDLMAKSLQGLFGPEGVGGTIIGALPQPIRQGGKYVIDPVFGVINWGLEELVDRPLGTGLTLLNVGIKDTGALFDLSTYAKAYAINDERTAGQALMAAAYLIDPFDQEDFTGLQSKPIFNLISGTVDFALEFADPTIYAGAVAVKAARGAAVAGTVSSTGKVTGTFGRRFANETRSSRLSVAPDANYVFGKGMGVRRATIAGRGRTAGIEGQKALPKIMQPLVATSEQVGRRRRVAESFIDERAVNFVNSQRFINLNNAVQQGATASERARNAKVIMGRSARHMSDRDIARWAAGETTEARALSMRVMLGDSAAHYEAIRIAGQIDDLLNNARWGEVDNYRKLAMTVGEDGVVNNVFRARDGQGKFIQPLPEDEILAMSKQYDELVGSVDWTLVHHMDEALREAMPKQLVIDEATGAYRVSDAVEATLRSVDTSVTHKAIEAMLKDIGELTEAGYTKPHSVFGNASRIRGMPNGSRLNELSRFHLKRLKETDESIAITSIVSKNPFTDADTVIQFVTERTPHSRIYFHDSQSTIQVERVMRDAARVVTPDGKRLIEEDAALRIVEDYETARAAGNIAEAQNIFLTEVRKLSNKTDNMFAGWFGDQVGPGRRGIAYERHILDEWELAMDEITDPALRKETVVGLSDENGKVTRSALIDESKEGTTHVANIRLSPKQLEQTAVLPRFDIVQKNFDRAVRRQSDVRADRIRAKAADIGTSGLKGLRKGTDEPMKYWRAGVLLTPKWPMRITIEEQLRMGSQLGAATTAMNLFKGVGDLRRAYGFFNFPNDKLLSDIDMITNAMRSTLGESVETGRVLKIDDALKAQMDEWGQVKKMPDDVKAERVRLQQQKKTLMKVDDLSAIEMMELLGTEGFQKIVDRLIREKVLTRRDLRRTQGNSALKAITVGMLFANPFVGGLYGFVSYGRKLKRMNQAGQRQAATNVAGAMRSEARRLMAGGERATASYKAGLDMMSEADYLKKLADEGNAKAAKARNAFEMADDLLEEAGFGKINIGGQAFRSGFGDDPRFIEQIQREVSANNWAQSVLRGAQKSAKREMDSLSYKVTGVLEYTDRATRRKFFDDRWTETIARFSSASGTDEFFNIVWNSSQTVQTRSEKLATLLKNDEALFDSIVADKMYHFADDVDYNTISEFIVREYENILPSGQFADLRTDIRSGVEVKWQQVEQRLYDGATDPKIAEVNFKKNMELMQEIHPQFGRVLHPETVASPNRVKNRIDGFFEDMFRMFGTLPSDELARFPFYKSVYDGELRRRTIPLVDEDGFLRISQNKMNDLEREAREYATQRTREVLYDLNEQTRMGEVIGNASPFFNAWQEVLGRWGGFAVDNPMFVAKVGQLYRQPWEAEFLGLTQVEVGEEGSEDTYIVWRPLGDAYDEEGNPTSVFNAMPDKLKDLFFPAAIRDGNNPLRFSKNGFNMISQGTPGFGPLITVPVRETLITNPELENTLGFMFPFGHPHGGFLSRLGQSLAPAWAKNVNNLLTDTHSKEVMVNRMFRDLTIQLAEAGDPLDWNDELAVMEVLEEAEKRTQNFFVFRVAAGLFSPTSTTVLSPYEPLVQKYRELEKEYDVREAQMRFLDEYGTDFFALTGRMSQLNDGVRATVENEELYRQNQELIQAHPAIGAWVSGSIGPVDENYVFSQVVYNRQFNTPTGPGSDITRRDVKSPVEYVEDTQIAQGWMEYSAMNDQVRNMQDQAENVGLSASLNAKHNQRIAELKSKVIDEISAKYPAWRKEFDDFGSSNQRMIDVYDGVAAALKYENIVVRPSTPHLMEFLSLRVTVQEMLEARKARGGSNNIEAGDNEDIKVFWEETKDDIGARPDFSPLYDRYFDRDRLLPQTFINAEDFPLSGMPRYA